MDLQLCYNASEDTFPLPLHIKQGLSHARIC